MAENEGLSRANDLREAADNAAGVVRTLYATFLLVLAYVAVTIGSTTDLQLLKIERVTLPLLDVGLPIVAFYSLAPWLVVLLHFNLLQQLYLLARNLHAFDAALADPAIDEDERRSQRERLFAFPFSHMLVGHHHSRLVRGLLTLGSVTTLLLLPQMLLLWAQLRFLPFHAEHWTWTQRAAVLADLLLLWLFWPLIMSHRGRGPAWWGAWRRWFRQGGVNERARGAPILVTVSAIVLLLSLLVAVVPGEEMEKAAKELSVGGIGPHRLTALWLDRPEGLFRRNLDLREQVLVAGDPPAEVIVALREGNEEERAAALKRVSGLFLRERDLRGADFSGAVLSKADLREADLREIDLFSADMREADVSSAKLQGADLSYTMLASADLSGASLQKADLQSADLRRADLRADLQGTVLRYADLRGTDLSSAELQEADLISARLQGANLTVARLQAAAMLEAELQGATLVAAQLQNALLSSAGLQGADLNQARLQEADLSDTDLRGTGLQYASLYAADLSGARLAGADFTGADLNLADLRGLDWTSLSAEEHKHLKAVLAEEIINEQARDQALARLAHGTQAENTLGAAGQAKDVLCDRGQRLPSPVSCIFADRIAEYDAKLAAFLSTQGCANAAAARAMVRRAYDMAEAIAVGEEPQRPLGTLLAEALLRPDCAGGAALPAEWKAALDEIVVGRVLTRIRQRLPIR